METKELVEDLRTHISTAIASRERAGIGYRSIQMNVDDVLQLCDAAEKGLT